jgi:hypothetical protein
VTVSLAYRRLTLPELAVLASLPLEITQTAVEECGSFLTAKEEIVYFIHQSAKDYLEKDLKSKNKSRLLPGGVVQGHADIYRRSIAAVSKLRKNIYSLQDFGIKPKYITPPSPDPLAPVRYSCLFWVDHLFHANGQNLDVKQELVDDGPVWEFFNDHFLRWLESLSLLGELSDSLRLIRKLVAQVYLHQL